MRGAQPQRTFSSKGIKGSGRRDGDEETLRGEVACSADREGGSLCGVSRPDLMRWAVTWTARLQSHGHQQGFLEFGI